jgi:hypothetical protein
MAIVARCPGCRKTFPWKADLPLPTRCPLPGCGYVSQLKAPETDEDGVIVITAPFIGSAKTKATDACYRELETSSAARAEAAAHMAGVPVSEMSHLKVTNLKDNTRPGEVAAMPVVNDVTRQMDRMRAMGSPVGFGGAQGNAVDTGTATGAININGQVIQGIQPHAGRRAMDSTHDLLTRTLGNRSFATKIG